MKILKDQNIIKALCCPICKAPMTVKVSTGASLVCGGKKTHCYDFASSGYVNLSSPVQSGGGDSKQAVKARTEFLELGYYQPVAEKLAELCERHSKEKGLLVDAGCGEGYYSCFLAEKGFSVFGADLSKFATDAAAKRFSRKELYNGLFAASSVFELPIGDGSVDCVTNVFAPCAEDEFSRVLKKDGILAVAYAGERHLFGLKDAIYKTAHVNTERADLPERLIKIDECRVTYSIELCSNEHIMSLFAMTPYYWRTSVSDGEKLKTLNTLVTEVDIIISVYQKQ